MEGKGSKGSRLLLAGLLAGAAVTALLEWALRTPGPMTSHSTRAETPPPQRTSEAVRGSASRAFEPGRARRSSARAAPTPFAPGEAWLAIGDAYAFGESAVRPSGSSQAIDVRCLDIREGVSLACPHGAASALVPLTSVGLPKGPADTAALVRDAPAKFPLPLVVLPLQCRRKAPGVSFVRAQDGRVYKVFLAGLKDDEDALKRRAHIRYQEVPSREGGGDIQLPSVDGTHPIPVAARDSLRRAVAGRGLLPHTSFLRYLDGDYKTVTGLKDTFVLDADRHLLVDGPLESTVTIPNRGSIFATGGLASSGRVELTSYSGFGVMGELAGTVDVKSYAYVYVDGDLTGTVNVASYATVVIERDLTGTVDVRSQTTVVVGRDLIGTLKVRGYTNLLVRGRIPGKIEFQSGAWSDFWFDGYWPRSRLESFPGNLRAATLHVHQSDLDPGKHVGIGTWGKVLVGEAAWDKLSR